MDEALWFIICTMLSIITSCSKKQGKVAVIQAGHVIETINFYWTAIAISIELGMVKAKQCLDFKRDEVVCWSQML